MSFYYLLLLGLCSALHSVGQTNTNKKINLWATNYYVPTVTHHENGIDLLAIDEQKIGIKLSDCDWCKAAIEGTVFVRYKKKLVVLNYAGRSKEIQYNCTLCKKYADYDNYAKTGKVLWTLSNGFGKGVLNYNLVPYKTIAVDSSVIPYGKAVYIPDAKGVIYTNTEQKNVTHDGYFFAADTGSKIIGNHIDVFTGTEENSSFNFIKSNSNKKFDAYIVEDTIRIKKLRKLHQ